MAQSPLDTWDTSTFEFQDTVQKISDRAEGTMLQSLTALIGTLTAKQSHDEALAYIERTIFNKDDLLRRNNSQTPQFPEDVLPDTIHILESLPEFQAWITRRTSNPSVLLLTGEAGTGKSSFIDALKRKLDGIQTLSRENDAGTFIAHHKFTPYDVDQKSMGLSKTSSLLSYALKCMALQIASQNRAYADDLRRSLQADQKISQSRDAGALWTDLKFSILEVPRNSTLYLLFDGLNVGHEEDQIISFTSRLFARSQPRDTLLKIFFTGDKETLRLFRLPLLDVTTMIESLMHKYIVRQLERLNIFQDKDEKSCANQQHVIECLARPGWMTFIEIKGKLQSLHEAIEQNESHERLDEILLHKSELRYPWSLDATKELVKRTTSRLSTKHLAELNAILAWYLYCERPLRLPELEAALHAENEHESFESLESKLKSRYSDVITSYGDYVCVQSTMKEYLEKSCEHSSDAIAGESPTIDLTFSVKNVAEPVFRQFIWDPEKGSSTGKFDFASCSNLRRASIQINKFEAQLKIVRVCLKVLNEGCDENTKAFFKYARDYLPKHLSRLAIDIGKISRKEKKFIGQNLATLLSDPYNLLKDKVGFGDGEHWLTNSEEIDSVRYFLRHTQELMASRERNWTKKVLNESEETLPTMKLWAQLNGRLWLQSEPTLDYQSIATPFKWLDNFTEVVSVAESRSETQGSSKRINPADIVLSVAGAYPEVLRNDLVVRQLRHTYGDNHSPKKTVKIDKVERALNWLEKQHVNIKHDGRHHLIVAATYHAIGEFVLARKHFEVASHDDILKKYTLFGLAKTCIEENAGNEDEGFKYMRDVIRLVSPDFSDGPPFEMNLYVKYMAHLGTVYYNHTRFIDAINIRKELLAYTPEDYNTRKEVFRCMCIWGDSTEATRFLEQWLDYTKHSGNKGLAELFCEEGVACNELSYLQPIRKEQKLLILLQKVAGDAAQSADQNFGLYGGVRPSIMYYQGLVMLMGVGPDRRELARQVWEEALYSRMPCGYGAMKFERELQPVANKLVQFKFDSVLAELRAYSSTAEERKAALSRDFTDYINSTAIHRAGFRAYEDGTAFIRASFAALIGNLQEARNLWSSTMTRALGYMSDNDPDKHSTGVYWLLRSFLAVSDKIGLLTAFSMCDRQRRTASTASSSSQATNTASNVEEQAVFRDGQSFHCPACSTTLNSWDSEGLWMCMFCERLELCSDCYRQFKSGEQNLWFCNPIHDYVHLVHTDYTEEEITPGKVLIDWEYEPLEDGKFVRRGGRIVDIAEWVEILRKQWNIPRSSEDFQEHFEMCCTGLYC